MKRPTKKKSGGDQRDEELFLLFLQPRIRERYQAWGGKSGDVFTDWLRFWEQDLSQSYRDARGLTEARKAEIMARWPRDIVNTVRVKEKALGRARKLWNSIEIGQQADLLKNEAAWSSVNETTSRLHYRFQIGFRNRGCGYWRNNPVKLGCLNCGYFYETTCGYRDIDEQNFLTQFQTAYERVREEVRKGIEPAFDVIEFLSDGSFFNDEEVPERVRKELFRLIDSDHDISKVLVETRPEYLSQDNVLSLLAELKREQSLEIAVGIECTDPFLLDFCINKGYGLPQLEQTAKLLSEINQTHNGRCSLLLYVLLKPAYLREREALETVVSTARDLSALAQRYTVPIIVKLEPVVIPEGTLLEVLVKGGRRESNAFSPPSYWTVLEVLARFTEEGLSHILRIGAREDMDRYYEIPAAYYLKGHRRGMLSRYDFILYEAVQEFNAHHDFVRTMAALGPALDDDSLLDWQREIGLDVPSFLNFYRHHRKSIEEFQTTDRECLRRKDALSDRLAQALTSIEYSHYFQELARRYRKNRQEADLERITRDIKETLSHAIDVPPDKIKINNKFIAILHGELRVLRMHIKVVKEEDEQDVRSVWIGIPSNRRVTWEK